MSFHKQGDRLDRLKSLSSYSIFFRPEKYGGEVKEYVGWVERSSNDVLRIYILAEQFIGKGRLRPEVEERLMREEYKRYHCLHMVNSDDDIELVHGPMPAKF